MSPQQIRHRFQKYRAAQQMAPTIITPSPGITISVRKRLAQKSTVEFSGTGNIEDIYPPPPV
jgi:hypothetical protein